MKVSIKADKIRFTILITLSLCGFIIRHIPNKELTDELKVLIIEAIKCVKRSSREYKGMKIVEVETADGQEVKITL